MRIGNFADLPNRYWLEKTLRSDIQQHSLQDSKLAVLFVDLDGFKEINVRKILHIVEDKRNNNYLWIAAQSGWYLLHIKEGIKATW